MPEIKRPLVKTRAPLEKNIQADIIAAINALPDATVWRNAIAHAEFYDERRGGAAFVRAGLPEGSADLIGCVAGRFLALEVKRPGQKQRPAQVQWMGQVRHVRGFYAVVTSVAEALAAVERCRRGEIT